MLQETELALSDDLEKVDTDQLYTLVALSVLSTMADH